MRFNSRVDLELRVYTLTREIHLICSNDLCLGKGIPRGEMGTPVSVTDL